jgi:starvation-inducible outer membrane lipoprotein
MRIQVNKNQQKINFKTHVGTIITIAEQQAKAGLTSFSYPIPRNQGISHWEIISKVEEETENSVYGGHKCVSAEPRCVRVKFNIRD